MSARHTQDQKGVEGETFVPQLAHTDEGVSLNTRQADAIVSGNGIRDHSFESTARKNFYVDTLSSLVSRVDANPHPTPAAVRHYCKTTRATNRFQGKGQNPFRKFRRNCGSASLRELRLIATSKHSVFAARVNFVHGREAQTLWFYPHP